ncbi:MAG TPA: hypothetical protein VKA40_10415 [Nitrososphaera sp.]|nr:hypothetical protein [Nitrososphaera sp.]
MSTEEDYSNRSHVRPNDPDSVPPPVTGELGLPRPPSNLISVEPHPRAGTVKLDAAQQQRSKEQAQDAKAEMFAKFRQTAKEVCVIHPDGHCKAVDAKALLLGDDSNYTLSDISFSEATGKQRTALAEYTPMQRRHLIEAHPAFVKQKMKEQDEQRAHRFKLKEVYNDMTYLPDRLKELEKIGPKNWINGPLQWRQLRWDWENSIKAAPDRWYQLLMLEKENPHLKLVGEQVREELGAKA